MFAPPITTDVLALVFVVSAVAKIFNMDATRRAVRDFGVPSPLVNTSTVILPVAELGVALGMLTTALYRLSAVVAVGLLVAFSAAIASALVRGRRVDCNCFGSLSRSPIGVVSLVRNTVLAAAFTVVFLYADAAKEAPLVWISAAVAARPLLSGVIAALFATWIVAGLLVIGILRQNGRLMLRLDRIDGLLAEQQPTRPGALQRGGRRPGRGDVAPTATLINLDGHSRTLGSLLAQDKPLVLILNPSCGPCLAMMSTIGTWLRDYKRRIAIAIISKGNADENRAAFTSMGASEILLQSDGDGDLGFGPIATPSAVVIRPDGMLGSDVVAGAEAIRDLMTRLVAETIASDAHDGRAHDALARR